MSFDVLDLFAAEDFVKVCAPMVRYSKLAFRTLARNYKCDLCFTPMILADSFTKSHLARSSEFSTNTGDKPLIVQFAANNVDDFCLATEMVAPYSNGVDLNCGCPQRWAIQDGYGSYLLKKPECIRDLVLQVRNKISHPYTVSVKIRILEDIRESVDLCRMLEAAGISFITVHGRTPAQRHQPININALCTIQDSVCVPVIANGDVKSLDDAMDLHLKTGCKGIMAARGMLSNPAMFTGHKETPLDCVAQWIAMGQHYNTSFQIFHHHLSFMLEKVLNRHERVVFNSLKNTDSVIKYLKDYYEVEFSEIKHSFPEENEYGVLIKNSQTGTKAKSSDNYEQYMENIFLYED